MERRSLFWGDHVFVERPDNHQHIVAALAQQVDQSLECGPLHRLVQSDPIEMSGLTARSRPGTMPGALWPALGIVLQLTWHFQLEEAAKHASPLWRETGGRGLPRCLQRPGGNALLIEIRILQMADPCGEGDISLDQHAEALGGIGPIGCDVRSELWHQPRVIEDLFLLLAEVGLRTAHPEDVAVENDLAVIE